MENTATNYFKDIFTILALSDITKRKDGKYTCYFSAFYIRDFTFEFEALPDKLDYLYNKETLFFILSYNRDFITKILEVQGRNSASRITFYEYSIIKFFEGDLIEKILCYTKKNTGVKVVLAIRNCAIPVIRIGFKLKGIELHGGDNTLKHMLSPLHFFLSKIIILLFGSEHNLVSISFSEISRLKEYTRSKYSLSSRDGVSLIKGILDERPHIKELLLKDKLYDSIIENSYDNSIFTDEGDKSYEVQELKDFNEKHALKKLKSKQSGNGIGKTESPLNSQKLSDERNKAGSKLTFRKINSKKLQKREFHTSLRLRSVSYKNTNYFHFINKLREVIDKKDMTHTEKQLMLENFLYDFVNEQILEHDIFYKKHKGYLYSFEKGSVKDSIHEALETYLLHERKGVMGKILPISKEDSLHLIILCYTMILSYFSRLGYTSIASIVGRNVMEFLYFKEGYNFISNDKKKKNHIEFSEFLKYKEVDDLVLLKIGDYFISLLSRVPHNIFERDFEKSTKSNNEVVKININPDYINSVVKNIILSPSNIPMICKPVDWSSKRYGGYLKNSKIKGGLITKSSKNKHETKINKPLYEAVNLINSIKFSVNNLLLNYLLNEGNYILDAVKPKDTLQRTITLKLAECLSDTHFYLTVRSDWRGRLVTESFFLTYQGNDLSVALTQFFEGEALNEKGMYYFKIHGANSHNMNGISKSSYFDRVSWVDEYYNQIVNLDRELILSAENPFSFASFCLNMRELNRDPLWEVKTPIFLDATCSGIQHLAALLRDFDLGVDVNLVKSSHLDKPSDLYNRLLEPINKAVNRFGENNPAYSNLSLIKFDRNSIKRSIMTKVYNVSNYGISEQLQEKFTKIEDENRVNKIMEELKWDLKKKNYHFYLAPAHSGEVILSSSDLMKIAQIINNEIFISYPSLKGIYDYFINVVKILVKLKLPMWWVTPNGMEIEQHYLKTKKTKLGINLISRKTFILRTISEDMDNAKQINAAIPNIIHSLDASHLIKVILTCSKGLGSNYNVITIHDCFGTHPNNMENLSYIVKSEFVLMYSSENFLKKFHSNVVINMRSNNHKVKKEDQTYFVYDKNKDEWIGIPDVPKLGELDLNMIKQSSYMIT